MSNTSEPTSIKPAEQSAQSKAANSVLLKIISFGYKEGPAPVANALFDMRFLKNPYWVEELRPLTGMDKPVQDYVMNQPAASQFVSSLHDMMEKLIPQLIESEVDEFSIAFGCTGGQHRSATIAELLAKHLRTIGAQVQVEVAHRELEKLPLFRNTGGGNPQ